VLRGIKGSRVKKDTNKCTVHTFQTSLNWLLSKEINQVKIEIFRGTEIKCTRPRRR